MATERKSQNESLRDVQPLYDIVEITNNNSTNAECREVWCGATDTYDLYVNGQWRKAYMVAGNRYAIYATGARHNSGSTAPDSGDIYFGY